MKEELIKKLLSCSGWMKPTYIGYFATYRELAEKLYPELGELLLSGTELQEVRRCDKGSWTAFWSPNSYKVILVNWGGPYREASMEVYHLNEPGTRKALEEAYKWSGEVAKLLCGD